MKGDARGLAGATAVRPKTEESSMFTGYREFDAYARSLRRTVWARQLEQAAKSIDAATVEITIGDLLGGEAMPAPRGGSEPRAAQTPVTR
jgi:hypothetical protein